MYKHALSVVSKAAYKTLKRGASSFVGTPPQVSPSFAHRLIQDESLGDCTNKVFPRPGHLGQVIGVTFEHCSVPSEGCRSFRRWNFRMKAA